MDFAHQGFLILGQINNIASVTRVHDPEAWLFSSWVPRLQSKWFAISSSSVNSSIRFNASSYNRYCINCPRWSIHNFFKSSEISLNQVDKIIITWEIAEINLNPSTLSVIRNKRKIDEQIARQYLNIYWMNFSKFCIQFLAKSSLFNIAFLEGGHEFNPDKDWWGENCRLSSRFCVL